MYRTHAIFIEELEEISLADLYAQGSPDKSVMNYGLSKGELP